ncbi:hypothetical protein TELCIR_19211 [Teladorsagia circumcincta]|uniref:Uncharacterized protein n=1 Tax=Teladorsagia circumcincta TaxID=45464 RepID=A0A2G9TMW1_TELCI|nr:hypothetical protein TELCIR_19211 [Teladorsagia circumcincta]
MQITMAVKGRLQRICCVRQNSSGSSDSSVEKPKKTPMAERQITSYSTFETNQ